MLLRQVHYNGWLRHNMRQFGNRMQNGCGLNALKFTTITSILLPYSMHYNFKLFVHKNAGCLAKIRTANKNRLVKHGLACFRISFFQFSVFI